MEQTEEWAEVCIGKHTKGGGKPPSQNVAWPYNPIIGTRWGMFHILPNLFFYESVFTYETLIK